MTSFNDLRCDKQLQVFSTTLRRKKTNWRDREITNHFKTSVLTYQGIFLCRFYETVGALVTNCPIFNWHTGTVLYRYTESFFVHIPMFSLCPEMTIIVSDKYPRDKVISIVEAAILFLKAIILACFASQKWNFTALIKRSWHGPRSDLSRMSEVATPSLLENFPPRQVQMT